MRKEDFDEEEERVDDFGESSRVIMTFGRRVTSFQIDTRESEELKFNEIDEDWFFNEKYDVMSLIHFERLNSMSEAEKSRMVSTIGLRSVAMSS
jgi:hypothetical protein